LPPAVARHCANLDFFFTRPMETTTTYEQIGGDATIARLAARFYELMDGIPQFEGLRAMHPESLEGSREKLYMFLSGWTGGPDLFVEKYGHPRLRQRHAPFAIGEAERDQWVACMVLAMEDIGIDKEIRARLLQNFFKTADFMRNTPG
jgi:hemoglobin